MSQTILPVSHPFYEAMQTENIWANANSLAHYLHYLFHDISFQGKTLLDIGAGAGIYSFYAAACGAKKVVALEPESAGSNNQMLETFHTFQEKLFREQRETPTVELLAQGFQEYDTFGDQFDIILLHNSINHLDEQACMALNSSEKAIMTYQTLFLKLYGLAKKDAVLVVADCSRYNFFRLLPIKNPFAPSIEWKKHQSPYRWSRLLHHAGFHHPKITWATPYKTGSWNRFLNNSLASFFWVSHFRLRMEK